MSEDSVMAYSGNELNALVEPGNFDETGTTGELRRELKKLHVVSLNPLGKKLGNNPSPAPAKKLGNNPSATTTKLHSTMADKVKRHSSVARGPRNARIKPYTLEESAVITARNRLSAEKSRKNKLAYITQLEMEVHTHSANWEEAKATIGSMERVAIYEINKRDDEITKRDHLIDMLKQTNTEFSGEIGEHEETIRLLLEEKAQRDACS
jgi:hypothetical protein